MLYTYLKYRIMELTSMISFIDEIEKEFGLPSYKEGRDKAISDLGRILKYKNFLKQPLTLGMFIPCDLEGNVLEEPSKIFYGHKINGEGQCPYCGFTNSILTMNHPCIADEYQQAKERVIFEGYEHRTKQIDLPFNFDFGIQEGFAIENLLIYKSLEITLTQTAIKQIS